MILLLNGSSDVCPLTDIKLTAVLFIEFPADRSLIARFFQDVHVIVQNALRLFSQDRTGLADYALESGGQKLRAFVFDLF